ncbi:Tn3 family transposase [Enterobacter sp. CPE_E222]|uniref:Tn3 family transposase n=1 Tax=Enterobacter sp. CPE_E222 TaxID=3383890 RepID=UPI00397639D6
MPLPEPSVTVKKGEIKKTIYRRSGRSTGRLGLVTNAVVLWNTIYMQAALDHLRAQGETLNDRRYRTPLPALPRTYQYARPLFLRWQNW